MKNTILALLAILTLSAVLHAEDSFDGVWRAEAPGRDAVDVITMEFKTSGTTLTGTIKRSPAGGNTTTGVQGKIDGDLVAFSVVQGGKTITFLGKLTGSQIAFTLDARGTPSPNDGGGTGIFGLNGPKTLVATRTAAAPRPAPAPAPARTSVVPQPNVAPNVASQQDFGTWQIQAPGVESLVLDLKTDGSKLTGGIRRIGPCCSKTVALEGMISNNMMMFSVESGGQTVAFMGKITGDEIAFTSETKGTPPPADTSGVFSGTLPASVTAKRVH